METSQENNQPKLPDQFIECVECTILFAWTGNEQLFYIAKHLQAPKRCPKCRAIRKLTVDRRPNWQEGAK